jgi:proteasome accessory factor B
MAGVDRLERLVNLVAALIDTGHPLTRSDIHQRIEGYAEDPDAFRRNFERDKELLREMGFPLVTVALDPGHPDDVGYQIPRELYELPDPGLDDSELAALRLAASAVQMEGEWGPEAVTVALRKLGGAAGPDGEGGEGPPRLAALPGEDAAVLAYKAISERRRVRFEYHGRERVVDPWRLSFHRGHWYLSGLDHSRGDGEERTYRLDRVVGSLAVEGPPEAFDRPTLSQAAPPPAWRLGEDDEVAVVIRVDADQALWARQAVGEEAVRSELPDGSVELEVGVTNLAAFRSFVLGFLDHAEVVGPASVRDDLVRWLEAIERGGLA